MGIIWHPCCGDDSDEQHISDETIARLTKEHDERLERERQQRERDALLLRTGQRAATQAAANTMWVLVQCHDAMRQCASTASAPERAHLLALAGLVRAELGWSPEVTP